MTVHHGNFVHNKIDWSDADLVLVSSTCYDEEFMQEISNKMKKLRKGAWILSLTKLIPNPPGEEVFKCVMSIDMKMSWGFSTLHV